MGEIISGFEPIPQTLETANPVEFEYPEELSSRDSRPSRTVIKHCEMPYITKPKIASVLMRLETTFYSRRKMEGYRFRHIQYSARSVLVEAVCSVSSHTRIVRRVTG